jgi:3-hydroxymyristoyl/3-hydroxydecanoyl-(acyl carrier protein) dehydratase
MSAIQASFEVPADHPCLDGHFPGNPLVPAVVILELAFEALRASLPRPVALRGVAIAKFVRPVRAGERVTVTSATDAAAIDATLDFRCETAAGLAAHGKFLIGESP